jgi:hypothetical protein
LRRADRSSISSFHPADLGGDLAEQTSDVPKHWVLHFEGLSPVSAYSLRKAVVEARRLSSIGHVMQRIIASSGDILINPEQIARIGDFGIARD